MILPKRDNSKPIWLTGCPIKVHFGAKNDVEMRINLYYYHCFQQDFLLCLLICKKVYIKLYSNLTQFEVLYNLAYIVKPSVGTSLLCLLTSHYLFPMKQ